MTNLINSLTIEILLTNEHNFLTIFKSMTNKQNYLTFQFHDMTLLMCVWQSEKTFVTKYLIFDNSQNWMTICKTLWIGYRNFEIWFLSHLSPSKSPWSQSKSIDRWWNLGRLHKNNYRRMGNGSGLIRLGSPSLRTYYPFIGRSFGYFDLAATQAPLFSKMNHPLKSIFSMFQMILSKEKNILVEKNFLDLVIFFVPIFFPQNRLKHRKNRF